MLSDLLPYALVTIALVAAWAFALGRLGYLTPSDVRAWRRLAALRGYAGPQTRLERAATRSPAIARLRKELDLRRLLAIADRPESDAAFLGRTAFLALLTFTAVFAVDVGARVGGLDVAIAPAEAVLIAAVVVLLRFTALRTAARRRQENAGRALGDMMMLVAIMTDGRGLQVEDSVRILSRCATTGDLQNSRPWRVAPPPSHHPAEHGRPVPADRRGVPHRCLHTGRRGPHHDARWHR